MSAYLVENHTVNALATFAADQGLVSDGSALALNLWCANRESVRACYQDRADSYFPDLGRLEQLFVYAPVRVNDPAALVETCDTFEYQMYYHPQYPEGLAGYLIPQIRECASLMMFVRDADDSVPF